MPAFSAFSALCGHCVRSGIDFRGRMSYPFTQRRERPPVSMPDRRVAVSNPSVPAPAAATRMKEAGDELLGWSAIVVVTNRC
jgi:hypothetical protein